MVVRLDHFVRKIFFLLFKTNQAKAAILKCSDFEWLVPVGPNHFKLEHLKWRLSLGRFLYKANHSSVFKWLGPKLNNFGPFEYRICQSRYTLLFVSQLLTQFFHLILNICFPSLEGNGVIKICVTPLIRGRKSIGVTQIICTLLFLNCT